MSINNRKFLKCGDNQTRASEWWQPLKILTCKQREGSHWWPTSNSAFQANRVVGKSKRHATPNAGQACDRTAEILKRCAEMLYNLLLAVGPTCPARSSNLITSTHGMSWLGVAQGVRRGRTRPQKGTVLGTSRARKRAQSS